MGSKPLSFHRAFRTPSALAYLLKRMPEIDINDLGLGDEDIISPDGNVSSPPPGQRVTSHEKPPRIFPCGRGFRKSKSPTKQVSQLTKTREDPTVHVTFSRSVSFHKFPKSHVSSSKGFKNTGTESQKTARRIAFDSESVMTLQKHCSHQGTGTNKNVSQPDNLNKTVSNEEDRHETLHEATAKRRKLVRFIDEPEIIPHSSVALNYESSEKSIPGHFHASINIFKMLKRNYKYWDIFRHIPKLRCYGKAYQLLTATFSWINDGRSRFAITTAKNTD